MASQLSNSGSQEYLPWGKFQGLQKFGVAFFVPDMQNMFEKDGAHQCDVMKMKARVGGKTL